MRYILVAISACALAVLMMGCPKKKPKTTACSSDTDCKDGLVCIEKTCQEKPDTKPECSSDSDCKDGQVCKAGSCTACASDGECGPGGKCNAGTCDRAKPCKADDECEDDEDCTDGYCISGAGGTTSGDSCELQTIYFSFDDSSIQKSEQDRLSANNDCIQKTGKSVYVMGHTDQTGTDEYNIALSERRARSAADYLSRLGADPAKLDVVGKGETEPTGQGDDQDRRVEFQFH